MASPAVKESLTCSVCMDIYKDPVTLPCGHNYCQDCIIKMWDRQEKGEYHCPECIRGYKNRPELNRNTRLRDLADVYLAEESKGKILCSYCIDTPTRAVKSCLQCESSFCDKHLTVHNKSLEHVLTEPTSDLQSKKCSTHKKTLDYYCLQDSAAICIACKHDRMHQGHTVETLSKTCKKRKAKCRGILAELTTQRTEIEKKIHNLRKYNKEFAVGITDRVSSLFRASQRQMEDLEARVLSEISSKKEQISGSVSGRINQLKMKQEELSKKIRHIEELCWTTDPLTVIRESSQVDKGNQDGGAEDDEKIGSDVLDETLISLNLWKELTNILQCNAMNCLLALEYSNVCLDESSAAANVEVSSDLKVAYGVEYNASIEQTLHAFESYQVLSSTAFIAGRHYWEVDITGNKNFRIGMCYASIERAGPLSIIGNNDTSWCLVHADRTFSFRHSNTDIILHPESWISGLGIYLDYEAGRLSFYELSNTVRHLHTFNAAFTEPLHAVFRVGLDVWIKIRT